jgi:hypothetical protein
VMIDGIFFPLVWPQKRIPASSSWTTFCVVYDRKNGEARFSHGLCSEKYSRVRLFVCLSCCRTTVETSKH